MPFGPQVQSKGSYAMQMSDQKEIAADPASVYAALLNPEVLKACVPGAQEVTGSPEEGFEAKVTQKVGPVKATFTGKVTLSDMVPGEKLTITGEGKGGAAGFAKGGAEVTLTPSDTGTLLSYDVEAKVGGKLAQLGSRIIDGFAKKMADQFFTHLRRNHQRVKPRHRMPTLAMLSQRVGSENCWAEPRTKAPKSAISLCAFVYAEGSAALSSRLRQCTVECAAMGVVVCSRERYQ